MRVCTAHNRNSVNEWGRMLPDEVQSRDLLVNTVPVVPCPVAVSAYAVPRGPIETLSRPHRGAVGVPWYHVVVPLSVTIVTKDVFYFIFLSRIVIRVYS